MQLGTFTWDADGGQEGQYTVEWLPETERDASLSELGIAHDDS